MPGMMDTLLDLGFSDDVEKALAAEGSAELAGDSRRRFTEPYQRIVTRPAPDDPYQQLRTAVESVFTSWDSPRAVADRAHHGLDDSDGTAVVVQAMVFGNIDANSGAGVVFSSNPMTAPTKSSASGCRAARETMWCRAPSTSSRSPRCADSSRASMTN